MFCVTRRRLLSSHNWLRDLNPRSASGIDPGNYNLQYNLTEQAPKAVPPWRIREKYAN